MHTHTPTVYFTIKIIFMYRPNVDLDFPLTYPVYLCSLSKTSTHLSLGSSATHPHISIWVLQQHIHTSQSGFFSNTSTHLSLGSSATHPHIPIWVLQQHIHTSQSGFFNNTTHLSLGSSATHPHISIWVLQQHIHTLTMIGGEAVDDVHVIPQGLLVFSSHQ